jgi:hypothetical protein
LVAVRCQTISKTCRRWPGHRHLYIFIG